jgi:hypothetical protein
MRSLSLLLTIAFSVFCGGHAVVRNIVQQLLALDD